jgi:hypothetical protein
VPLEGTRTSAPRLRSLAAAACSSLLRSSRSTRIVTVVGRSLTPSALDILQIYPSTLRICSHRRSIPIVALRIVETSIGPILVDDENDARRGAPTRLELLAEELGVTPTPIAIYCAIRFSAGVARSGRRVRSSTTDSRSGQTGTKIRRRLGEAPCPRSSRGWVRRR